MRRERWRRTKNVKNVAKKVYRRVWKNFFSPPGDGVSQTKIRKSVPKRRSNRPVLAHDVGGGGVRRWRRYGGAEVHLKVDENRGTVTGSTLAV